MYRGYIDKNHKIELVSSFDHINSDLIFLVAKDENDEREGSFKIGIGYRF